MVSSILKFDWLCATRRARGSGEIAFTDPAALPMHAPVQTVIRAS